MRNRSPRPSSTTTSGETLDWAHPGAIHERVGEAAAPPRVPQGRLPGNLPTVPHRAHPSGVRLASKSASYTRLSICGYARRRSSARSDWSSREDTPSWGKRPAADFREVAQAVRREYSSVEHLIQFSPPVRDHRRRSVFHGTWHPVLQPYRSANAKRRWPPWRSKTRRRRSSPPVPPAAPRRPLLSHRNITCQNLCLGAAFGFAERTRLLVNLPPSHVGGQAEALMSTLFWGGTAIVLEVFDAARGPLEAIHRHSVNVIGQIPAMYHYEWRQAGPGRRRPPPQPGDRHLWRPAGATCFLGTPGGYGAANRHWPGIDGIGRFLHLHASKCRRGRDSLSVSGTTCRFIA